MRSISLPRLASGLLLATLITAVAAPLAAQDGKPAKPKDRYVALSAAGDPAGLVKLFQEVPHQIIPIIDSDLEGALGMYEKEGEAKRKEIDALISRAVAGAHAAVEATGQRRILDYVTSFAGWTDDQKKQFRRGQKAFGAAIQGIRSKDFDTALAKGRECRELAEPLGDWWGTAMGLQAEGMALAGHGKMEEAVTALSRSRLIYRELNLISSALRIEGDLADKLITLGRIPRAKAMISDGKKTAEKLGIAPLVIQFAELEKKLPKETAKKGATTQPKKN